MKDLEGGEHQIQINLKTKQPQYAVPDVPYVIHGNASTTELNTFVNALLDRASNYQNEDSVVEFDFLVFDEYLYGSLCSYLREKGISFEDTIDVEYVERFPAPHPQDCLLHDDWVSAVATSGKWVLSGCYDNTINLWNTKGEHILTMPGHTMPIKAVAWVSLDDKRGKFVSCSQDQTAMLWDWLIESNSVECISVCKGHERGIDCIAVSNNSERFATGSWDTMLKIWSTDTDERSEETRKRSKVDTGAATKTPMMTLQGHREAISTVQWMDNETLLTASWDHTMKIWDLNLEGIKSEICANKSIFDASYSNLNHLIVTASADKNIRLYDPRASQSAVVRNTYLGHQQWVQTVMWSTTEEYLFVSGSYDSQIKLWDCRSPRAPLYDLLGHGDKILDIDWSNPKFIVSGAADNTVRIYKTRKAIHNNTLPNVAINL